MQNEHNQTQNSSKKKKLGRGLGSLIPGVGEYSFSPEAAPLVPEDQEKMDGTPGITYILLNQIRSNPFQPRKEFKKEELQELSNSILEHGLIQPIVVRRAKNNTFQLIAGERRWRASKMAGLEMIPAIVKKATDRDSMELAIVENIQRSDLNPVDEALAYYQLIEEFGISQDEVAKRVGKERSTVTNLLRILKLPDMVLQELKNDGISLGHAKVLLQLGDMQQQEMLFRELLQKKYSVRDLEMRVKELKEPLASRQVVKSHITEQERDLVFKQFNNLVSGSAKIALKEQGKKVKIELIFKNIEDLNRTLSRIERM